MDVRTAYRSNSKILSVHKPKVAQEKRDVVILRRPKRSGEHVRVVEYDVTNCSNGAAKK